MTSDERGWTRASPANARVVCVRSTVNLSSESGVASNFDNPPRDRPRGIPLHDDRTHNRSGQGEVGGPPPSRPSTFIVRQVEDAERSYQVKIYESSQSTNSPS